MHLFHRFGHVVGGTLLVTGITLGVGMLALPLASAAGGFIPSVTIYVLTWLFMLATGLLILEACTWMPKNSNLITMAHTLLGKKGKVACWILYLFLFSCLMVAHIAGGGSVLSQLTGGAFPSWINIALYIIVFSPVVYLGTLWVDRLNFFLIAGIAISYLVFIAFALPHVNISFLTQIHWAKSWSALPIVFTAFGYQILIPTLMTYLNRDLKKVRLTIIFGTTIPLVIYIIWSLLILGIVPQTTLTNALNQGQTAISPLSSMLNSPLLLSVGKIFAFCVLTTSFNGIAIAFVDFLADGLKVEKKGMKKLGLCLLVFVVPTLIAIIDPTIFIKALDVGGGIGIALLLGAMPIAMVWSGRYYKGYSLMHQQVPGGKILLSILMAFALLELYFQFY
jgi:tyrosine-specific transport protein